MTLRPIRNPDFDAVISLIRRAMNEDEGRWAATTIRRHLLLASQGIDDGRLYLVADIDGVLIGISGLHHYEWGPPENTWLGWFALDPDHQGLGHGQRMMEATEDAARERGHRKLFIEAYDSPTFATAIAFYQRMGFTEAGSVADYLPDGSPMKVLSKRL